MGLPSVGSGVLGDVFFVELFGGDAVVSDEGFEACFESREGG